MKALIFQHRALFTTAACFFLLSASLVTGCKKNDAPSGPTGQERVVLLDNFDNNNNNWFTGTSSTGNSVVTLQNGQYTIYFKDFSSGNLSVWGLDKRFFSGNTDSTRYIETSLKRTAGNSNSAGGLLWTKYYNSDTDNEDCQFYISDYGEFSIGGYNAAQQRYISIVDRTHSSAIKTNDWNKARVEQKGNVYSFYINDQQVYQTTMNDGGRFDYPCLFAHASKEPVTIAFDYLKIAVRK